MQENASASQAAPEEISYSDLKPKRPNIVILAVVLLLGSAVVVSAFLVVRTIRNRQLASANQNNTVESQEANDGDSSTGQQTYLDSSNRFRLAYPLEVTVIEDDVEGTSFKREDIEILKISPKSLSGSTVKEFVETISGELEVSDTAIEITMIGSRAGYTFEDQETVYMFFPLGFDSILEIETSNRELEGIDLEAIIQSIEFLPLAQTS